ncbi:RtcB family protein [Streptosporangium sp. NBC_01495]|uniref:RtcB family protein n=1 Tax=Streptosporangium sp. NBC_01495 TaxID=2903899 RepID=UPI003FCD5BAC
MGATVGPVIPADGAIIPSAVGVDIGCGMVGHRDRRRPARHADTAGGEADSGRSGTPKGRAARHGDVVVSPVTAHGRPAGRTGCTARRPRHRRPAR